MFRKFTWGALAAILLPAGMVMAQGHGPSAVHGGHGAPHVSSHAGVSQWSGHPGGASFGGSSHWAGHPGTWNSSQWAGRPGGNWDVARASRGGARYGWSSGYKGWNGRNWAWNGGRWGYSRYRDYRYGRGFYPYSYWGYPYWGYGSWYGSGYPYAAYSNWLYPYSDYSYGYPYDFGYSSLYPDYGTANDYGVEPPLDDGYGAGPAYTDAATSSITITAPPGAELWVEGVKIASATGTVHTFQTPPLNPDQQYRYQVRAAWTGPDGRRMDQSQEVVFSAGAGVAVRFPLAQAAPVPQA